MVVELKGGFKPLFLRFDSDCSAPHQLFVKEHSVRNQEPQYPRGRTLFILNVPPWASYKSLKATFSKLCGPVTSTDSVADEHAQPKQGFGKVFLVFERESSLDKALAIAPNTSLTLYKSNKGSGTVGLPNWYKEYNKMAGCSEASMKQEIEEYMREYDERIARNLRNENGEQEDEDGWVTVSSRKKRGQFAPARKESTIGKLQSKEERKNRKKELLNFYTFQIRESKKKHLVELRKKFELDKQKLEQLKTKRTFKPF